MTTSAAPANQPKPTEETKSCVTDACHVDITNRPNMHTPTRRRECMTCHAYAVPERHLFRLTHPRRDLCRTCHTLTTGPRVHQPVTDGDCTGCHDPHGSEHDVLLLHEPGEQLCAGCHTDDYAGKPHVHGPVAIGACVVCHNSHSSSYPGLLTSAPTDLCVGCHIEMTPSGPEARHLHQPTEDGCVNCHDPHASQHAFQLKQVPRDLCFSCHTGIQKLVKSASVTHGPTLSDNGCTQCHNPHFTRLPRLQKKEQPDICLDCHNEPLKTADGRTLADMAALLKNNPDHHGPIREGACTTCHQPHAGEHFGMLVQSYPPEFYAPFEIERYRLCFSCHISELVLDESGTGLTEFRNGDLNLHWLHVNREKGRTCRACHEVHASKRPFHIRDAVPYGSIGWMLPINFEKTDTGGTCEPGCHKPKTYDRTATVEVAEQTAQNNTGTTSP